MELIKKVFLPLFLFFVFLPLSAQSNAGTVSLAAEISRLQELAGTGGKSSGTASTPRERYNAFLELARLYRLSGNPEAALKAYGGALTAAPGDKRALLEQGRLFLSLGNYEKAGAAITSLLDGNPAGDISLQAKYLNALLAAFRAADTRPLAALADDPELSQYRGRIYYTLWKLTGLVSWKNRLLAEFPRTPEAGIAGGSTDPAAAPLWLLFPGRDGVFLSAADVPGPSAPETRPAAVSPAPRPSSETSGVILQTGLFSREENAAALAERLRKAGFAPGISRRRVNGNDLWAVSVPAGEDMNTEIAKLKSAGFESFPVR